MGIQKMNVNTGRSCVIALYVLTIMLTCMRTRKLCCAVVCVGKKITVNNNRDKRRLIEQLTYFIPLFLFV